MSTTTEVKYNLSDLLRMSNITEGSGDSDGDIKIELNDVKPQGNITLNPAHIGWETQLTPYTINNSPVFLHEAGAGIDAWFGLYTCTNGEYTLSSGYSYDWDMSEEDVLFSNLNGKEKVKFLYLKGIHLPE